MVRLAIVTPTLSHFEVPLFREAAKLPGIETVVFHQDASAGARFDSEYKTMIDWGEDLQAGYDGRYFSDSKALRKDLWGWKPDVVILYGYIGKGALPVLFQAKARGIPVVLRGLLSPYIDPRASTMSKIWRQVRPFMLRLFSGHHYGGSYGARVLDGAGIPAKQRYFVPFSVDTPYFAGMADDPVHRADAEALRVSLGWASDDPVLLFMCQHNWFKGPDIMLEIARLAQEQVAGLKLIMAGAGRMTDDLQATAAATLREGSFHFPGYVSSKSTMKYYLASDLVAFPSRYDTWSRAVNEAMLCRRPCIVSHMVPACGGLVDDGVNGIVVQGLEPGDYAVRIAEYFAKRACERTATGERARERALEFAYSRHMDAFSRSVTDRLKRKSAA